MSERRTPAPRVSVILPNRNHAHYLSKAVDALLEQTWRDFELLIVDDASSDRSREIVNNYAAQDTRVRLLALDAPQGIHRAVQAGITQAKGEFVYIAAADDFVESTFLERCVRELERFPAAGLCFSDPSEYYRDPDRVVLFPLYLSDKTVYFDGPALSSLFARNYFHISPNTGIYRLASFRAAGGYIHEFDWLSDWFLTTVVALRHGACYLSEQLTYVAIRKDSYSAQAGTDRTRRRMALHNVLEKLSTSEYCDVFPRLRQAAILPEYHFITLLWLLQSRHGRRLLSPRLLGRMIALASWSLVRGRMPARWRRRLRRSVSRKTKGQSAT